MYPISDIKMYSLFQRLGERVIKNGDINVVGGYDSLHDEYLLTFPGLDTGESNVLNDFEEVVGDYTFIGGVSEELIPLDVNPGATYDILYITLSTPNNSPLFTLWFGTPGNLTQVFTGSGIGSILGYEAGEGQFYINTKSQTSLTFKSKRRNPHVIDNGEGKTYVFSSKHERWTFAYQMVPEWIDRVGDTLVCFKAGFPFTHDDDATTANLLAKQKNGLVSQLINQNPFAVKIYNTINLDASRAPDWVHFRTEEDDYVLQSSDLENTDFTEREGNYFAAILRDRLSPNFDVDDSYYEISLKGDNMRGKFLKVAIQYNGGNEKAYIRFSDIGYKMSTGQNAVLPSG